MTNTALKPQAKKLMRTLVSECVDRSCNEVNYTLLAENTAHALDRDEWLDDETHWIWELAVDVGNAHERTLGN